MTNLDYSNKSLIRWFDYKHLPSDLQQVSRQFYDLAYWIQENLDSGTEKTAALRKLLESKDAAVRAKIESKENLINSKQD